MTEKLKKCCVFSKWYARRCFII